MTPAMVPVLDDELADEVALATVEEGAAVVVAPQGAQTRDECHPPDGRHFAVAGPPHSPAVQFHMHVSFCARYAHRGSVMMLLRACASAGSLHHGPQYPGPGCV